MTPKKKKKVMVISVVVSIVVIMTVSFIVLYLTTDMFKSNKDLFIKYMSKNRESIDTFFQERTNQEYETLLEQKPYTSKIEGKINYIRNVGSQDENTRNAVNQLKLQINGNFNQLENYRNQQIELFKEDESVAKLEYFQNGENYGIKFPNLFEEFIVTRDTSLNNLYERMELEARKNRTITK